MRPLRTFFRLPAVLCTVWIALCFSLTSAVWLSWSYHLVGLTNAGLTDAISMVAGYLMQAAGVGVTALFLKKRPNARRRPCLTGAVILFAVVSLPALLSPSPVMAAVFGLLMNGLCGVIAGFYLLVTAEGTESRRRGLVFGCGYGISTVLVWVLSLVGESSFLRTRTVLGVYALLAAGAVWLARPLLDRESGERPADSPREGTPFPGKVLALAGVTVFLLSLVKNLGFSFPSADLETGISLEFSRLFYAVGLVAAGLIGDRRRKYGAVCTAAALAIPFVMLALRGETVPVTICWILDYLFFGFFSVFRVVLFMDLAAGHRQWHLALLGLLFGRMGDAAGTALCMGLAGSRVALIVVTLALFIVTVFLFFRLYQRLYVPEAAQEKSEREVFEGFSIQHDLSTREKEVLRLVLAEQGNTQIAEALFVSESTIKYHVHNLLQKTGCKSRQELVRKYHLTMYPRIGEK